MSQRCAPQTKASDLTARRGISLVPGIGFPSIPYITSTFPSRTPGSVQVTSGQVSSNAGRSLAGKVPENLIRDEGHYETQRCVDFTFLFSLGLHGHSNACTRDKVRREN